MSVTNSLRQHKAPSPNKLAKTRLLIVLDRYRPVFLPNKSAKIRVIGLLTEKEPFSTQNLRKHLKKALRSAKTGPSRLVLAENPVTFNIILERNINKPVTDQHLLPGPNRWIVCSKTTSGSGNLNEALIKIGAYLGL